MSSEIHSLADRIRRLREKNGMTQAELARRVGLTRSSINGWEMGLVVPSTANVVELSKIFHVSTDYLLCLTESESVVLAGLSEKEKEVVYSIVERFLDNKNS
jgi:transcriptional regulator with XRE-family HTH domain